jgi:NADH dehydrogenase
MEIQLMEIVLLGGTGFVGQHLLSVLSAAGHRCRVLTRNPARHRELGLVPGVALECANVFDRDDLVPRLEGADVAVNLIGILNEKGRNGMGFWKAHVEVVENLVEACMLAGVPRLIHVSALNAGQGKSFYLRSKGRAEEIIAESGGLEWTIIQPSVMFGRGDSFFNRFAGVLRWTPVLPLACYRSKLQPVWVDDVCRAIGIIVDRGPGSEDAAGATLVMVGPKTYTLIELVRYAARAAGLRRRVVGIPDFAARMQGLVMDFVPGKPFSTDNYHSLQIDSTSVENALWRFGIAPEKLETVVPGYLGPSLRQNRMSRMRSQ